MAHTQPSPTQPWGQCPLLELWPPWYSWPAAKRGRHPATLHAPCPRGCGILGRELRTGYWEEVYSQGQSQVPEGCLGTPTMGSPAGLSHKFP